MANAFLYDFMLVNGGAEQLALTAVEQLPNLELHAGFVNPNCFASNTTPIHSIGQAVAHPALQALCMLRAFRRNTAYLSDYETVFYSGSYAPVAVFNHLTGPNIYYCHTPPRFVYDLRDYYRQQIPFWQRPVFDVLVAYVQPRFEAALAQMDQVICNSQHVQQRLQQYTGVDSVVIYPPVETELYQWLAQGDYYLSTARLAPYKRVDLIVKAFLHMPDKKLIVASGGTELSALKKLANHAANIIFTDWISQADLLKLVGNAIATIYLPRYEDFGISPVESMAAGKPVIGIAEGGLLETIVDGETGILLQAASVESLTAAVQQLTPAQALQMRFACTEQAQKFTRQRFIEQMHVYVSKGTCLK